MLVVALVAILHEAVLGLRFFLEREQTLLNSTKNQKQSISTVDESIPNNKYVNEQNIIEEFTKTTENITIRSELKNIFRFIYLKIKFKNICQKNIKNYQYLNKKLFYSFLIKSSIKIIFRRTFTRTRMLQAMLYALQWCLFIFAFVLVPCGTFNIPLILAALTGKTAGYLVK